MADNDLSRRELSPVEQAKNNLNFRTFDERCFRALVENAPVGMFHVDKANGWVYRNQTLVDLVGLPSFEALPASTRHYSWIHPDDYERYQREFRESAVLKRPQEIEFRLLRPDGSQLHALQRAVPELDEAGNIRSWTGSVVDISERKRIEVLEGQERDQMLQLSTALGSVTSDGFFDTLLRVLTETIPADMAFIREYVETPRPHLRYVCGRSQEPFFPVYDQLLSADEIAALAQVTKPATAPQTTFKSKYSILSSYGMQDTVISILRYADGRLLGNIVVSHHAPLDLERISHILDLFAVRAAAELERQHNQQALAEQRENLRWLNELSVRIHDTTNRQEICGQVVQAMAEHVSAPLVSISVFDDHPTDPVCVLANNWNDPGRPRRLPRLDSVFERIYANDGVLIVTDIHGTFGDRAKSSRPDKDHVGIVAVAMLLLKHGERELGLIILEYTSHGFVERLDREVLRALTKMLSLALSNAQHFEDMEYKATHDSLTGLFNRNVLHTYFERHIGIYNNAALMLLDLDRFKEVNDTLGHNIGDQVLRQVAERLREEMSSHGTLVVRLGGDEFAILVFDDNLDNTRALALGQQVLTSLLQPFVVETTKLDIGASVGIARYPLHGQDSHSLLRSADVAMYAAKHQRAGMRLYDPQLDTHTPERLGLMADLTEGIRDGQLELYYQPKLDLKRHKVTACEALVRWNHPRLGLLAPDRFIPLAEMSEAIHALTARVIEDACRQQQQWRNQGVHLRIAVNLSARNLLDDRIVEQIERMLIDYALPPNTLELEITETALMQDPKNASILLDRLAGLGVRVAVDDFGTGYSSLTYLRRLPLSTLKIDRTFISEMLDKPQDLVIVQSIISLAHNLGLEVVAEGVESEEVLNCLQVLGCDQIQGYYLSRPIPAEDMLFWLQNYVDATALV